MIFTSRHRFRITCIIVLFLLQIQLGSYLSAQSVLQRRIDFTCIDCTPADALLNIYRNTSVNITFSNDFFKGCPNISIDVKDHTIESIITTITAKCKDVLLQAIDNEINLSLAAPKIILSGHVLDKETNERLIGCTVQLVQNKKAKKVYTNEFGFFSHTLLAEQCQLIVTYPGYDTIKATYIPSISTGYTIKMVPALSTLEGVEIVATLPPSTWTELKPNGAQIIPINTINTIPSVGGQADLMRTIALSPGIQTGVDGLGGIHVRGGNNDQNLILLDDVPVYNPSHVIGLLSIFNADLMKNAKLWKGNFPARYSGRTSSVIDVRTRDGNSKHVKAGLNINALSSAGYLEGPISRRKRGAFVVGFRHSTFRPWVNFASSRPNLLNIQFSGLSYNVQDLNVKLNQKLSEKDEVFVSYYFGNDRFDAPFSKTTTVANQGEYFDQFKLKSNWGNSVLALRWNHVWAGKVFTNTTLSNSRFVYKSRLDRATEFIDVFSRLDTIAGYSQIYQTDIRDKSLRIDNTYIHNSHTQWSFGGAVTLHRFKPGALSVNLLLPGQTKTVIDSLANDLLKSNDLTSVEWEGYGSVEHEFPANIHLNTGVNASVFSTGDQQFKAFLPRFNLYHGKEDGGFKQWISHTYMAQYLHQIGSFNVGLPFELWVPSTNKIRPERSRQTVAGLGWSNKNWGITVEGYLKKMNRVVVLLSFNDALITAGAQDASGWEDRVISGEGASKGLEFLVEKKTGKTRGMMSYTLSRSTRRFDELNQGRPFVFQFDRTHDLKVGITHYLTEWLSCSANWVFATGNPITLAGVKYKFQSPENPTGSKEIYYFSQINGYRLPANHRLDLALNLCFNHAIRFRPIKHTLQLGVYNAYNRANPFYLVIDVNSGQTNRAIQYTLLPVLPTFRYTLTF